MVVAVFVVVVAEVNVQVEEAGAVGAVVVPVRRGMEGEPRPREAAGSDHHGTEGAQRAADESTEPAHRGPSLARAAEGEPGVPRRRHSGHFPLTFSGLTFTTTYGCVPKLVTST